VVVTEIEASEFRCLRENTQWDLGDEVVFNTDRLQMSAGREGGVERKGRGR
jgi:hypothetical protein